MKHNSTQDEIIKLLEKVGRSMAPHEIIQVLGKSAVTIHKNLKNLLMRDVLEKTGSSPKVYYRMNVVQEILDVPYIENEETKYIDKEFVNIDSTGQELQGMQAFARWCEMRHLDVSKMQHAYVDAHRSYMQFRKDGVIDATHKIATTFPDQQLDKLFFLYPYSLPIFGKTKIATRLFYGKQIQNKVLIQRVLDQIIPEIKAYIEKGNYSAISFVPPTVPRVLQFMNELQKQFDNKCIMIPIQKVYKEFRVQQKSLKDVNERVRNANATFIVPTQDTHYKKVLVIDDFTGSGATLNVLAGMLKRQHIATQVDGLTITGSMNGFEIIKEV